MTNSNRTAAVIHPYRWIMAAAIFGLLILSSVSLSAQAPPPGNDTALVTGVPDESAWEDMPVWSSGNKVTVDFRGMNEVDVTIGIYDISGRCMVAERVKDRDVYTREMRNTEAGYVVVKIMNGERWFTRRLFIINQ